MNINEMNRTDSFKRIDVFGDESAADFPAGSKGVEIFARNKARVARIDAASAGQASAKGDVRQGYLGKGTARENVRASCASIAKTARGAAYDVPGLDVKFYLAVDLTDAGLLAHAQMILMDAPEHKAKLIEWGEDEDFLEDLTKAVGDFEQAMGKTSAAIGEQVEATTDISEEVREGMVDRRQLNVIVCNRYKNNPAKLAAWQSAYHIAHPKTKKKVKSEE